MELLTPNLGLIFWTLIVFLVVLFILSKYAWKPIMNAIKEREETIEESLKSAQKARDEMASMKADNEKLLNEAREERMKILKDAKEVKENIINEAKERAKQDAAKIMEDTKREIENQKNAAMAEVKNQTAALAMEIAEKILRKELDNRDSQERYVEKLVDDFKMN